MRHLAKVSEKGQQTGMTARNIAIVWAPNLLRCKELEVGGVAALQGVCMILVIKILCMSFLIDLCVCIFNIFPSICDFCFLLLLYFPFVPAFLYSLFSVVLKDFWNPC